MKAVATKQRSASAGGEKSLLRECTLSLDEAHYDDKFRYLMFHTGDAVHDQVRIPVLNGSNRDRREAMAERLSAAWNACKGIGNDELERLDGRILKSTKEANRLRSQRDKLLIALREIAYGDHVEINYMNEVTPRKTPGPWAKIARAAIAKTTEGGAA